MRILYLITARGGSKGLPHKNIRPLNGKPLIQYSIDLAREFTQDEHICVSTDSHQIKEIVELCGLKVPFLRPTELATDLASSEAVIRHALDYYAKNGIVYDYVLLLQPTSPLRQSWHIKEALDLISTETEMVISVKESDANPYYNLFIDDLDHGLVKFAESNFTRRQDCPKIFESNGAIYIINVTTLSNSTMLEMRKKKYVMDKKFSIDIDDEMDLKICEYLIQQS